jgi:dihydroorotase
MDLVVRNGRVVDPSEGLDSILDVGISGNKVVSVAPDIEVSSATKVIDAGGCLVLPGLIDFHTHVFYQGGPWGVDPDALGPRTGVTTMVDAGSAGAGNFHGFYQHVIKRSKIRIKAFLHIAFNGLEGCAIYAPEDLVIAGELEDIRRAMVRPAVEVAARYRNAICGIKVRASVEAAGGHGLSAIDLAQQAAELLDVPVMVHIGTPPPTRKEILKRLRSGDVLTHSFRGEPNGPCNPDGSVVEEMLAARDRGVLFDIGHGVGSFAFDSGRKLIEAGFLPDMISSDVHTYCINRIAFNLPTTMSKFLALGMDLKEIIRATTATPASFLGLKGELGSIKTGYLADISVFRLADQEVTFTDAFEESITANQIFVPVATIRDGKVLWAERPVVDK